MSVESSNESLGQSTISPILHMMRNVNHFPPAPEFHLTSLFYTWAEISFTSCSISEKDFFVFVFMFWHAAVGLLPVTPHSCNFLFFIFFRLLEEKTAWNCCAKFFCPPSMFRTNLGLIRIRGCCYLAIDTVAKAVKTVGKLGLNRYIVAYLKQIVKKSYDLSVFLAAYSTTVYIFITNRVEFLVYFPDETLPKRTVIIDLPWTQ